MKILCILVLVACVWGKPFDFVTDEPVCGYESCHKVDQNKINVHMVPHSHDDVGWLQTVDGYYYNEVEQILTSVVNALAEDSDRRFIQVETAFLYMWWSRQNDQVRSLFKKHVEEGRLEIVNGAWSMNDEGAVHYQSTIDQYTLGLRYVQDIFGTCARPKVSWQIDTFGHSREHASLVSQFGMDGLFFARFDYRDRAKRLSEKTMEMLWTSSANLGSDSNVFTSALYNHYSSPRRFCFDILCGDEPIIDDRDSLDYNLEDKVKDFSDFIAEQSQYYTTNNIIITMGDDFHYQAASKVYINIDRLIRGFKEFNPKIDGKEVNMIYSTPSCYMKAVHDYIQEKNLTLNVKTDDFLPYAHEESLEWTGYFTTRPTSKKLERLSNNILQVSKQLGALAGKSYDANFPLNNAMGIMQHHDAITGTELDNVEKDYHRLLAKGIEKVTSETSDSFSTLLGLSSDLNLISCPLLNTSVCSVANENEFSILVYNPLARTTSHYLQIPVQSASYQVEDQAGDIIESHITDPIDNFEEVPDRLPATLFFRTENLPALGYKVYKVKKLLAAKADKKTTEVNNVEQMGFEDRYVNFDPDTGYLRSITLFNQTLEVTQQFLYYKSAGESNAWIFRPKPDEQDAIELKLVENSVLINDGNLVREVKQTFERGISQVIRIYKEEDFIEFDWLIGSQNIADGGREIITRYTTKLKDTHDEYYTDSNGREMIARKKNYRPTYDYTDEQPQSGNYYPVNTRVVLKNDDYEFAVLTDRSEGGGSLELGQVELMVARQIPGVDEYEYGKPVRVRGSHYITHGVSANGNGGRTMAAVERDIVQRKMLQPWLFFTKNDVSVTEKPFLNRELPANVHLLTLESWTENTVLIRLEHVLEKDEDPELSKETKVDLTDLFKPFVIQTMKEYMLAANVPLEESERLSWSQIEPEDTSSPLSKQQRLSRDEADLNIILEPMQIRTFVAAIVPRESS